MNVIKRGYHQLNAKVGRADETVNIAYNQEVERFKQQYNVMKKLITHLNEYLKALKALGQAHAGLNEGIGSFYDMASDLWALNLKNQENGLQLDKYRMGLDEELDKNVVAPLNKHMAQYKEMKKRMKERENRKLDYDRLRAEVKRLTVNPNADPAKLQKTQRQAAQTKQNFEELEAELMRDLPLLHNDRLTFFDPCFATIINVLGGYYRSGTALFEEMGPMASHINPNSIHEHGWVITENNRSAARKKKGDSGGGDDYYETLSPPPSTGSSMGGSFLGGGGGNYGQQPPPSSYGGGGGYGQQQPQQIQPYGGGGYGQPPMSQQGGMRARGPSYGAPPATGGGGPPPSSRGRALPKPQPRGLPSPGGARGMPQAQGMYQFQASSDQELSFNVGDVLTVHDRSGDWWDCELYGRRGLVPGNYLQLL